MWLAAIATALPTLLVSSLVIPEESLWHKNGAHYICQEEWADPEQKGLYTMVLMLLQFCLPLAILIFNYGRIGLEIWGKKTPGEAHQDRDLRMARSKRKVTCCIFLYFTSIHSTTVCVVSYGKLMNYWRNYRGVDSTQNE